jgi:transposase
MKTKIRVADHLPFDEIEKRYRKATDGMARGHWQVIWLIAQGTSAQHVADMTGYSYTWVRTLVQRYNQDGPDALDDGRHANAGGQCILSAQQQQQLQEALEHDPPDRGLWSGPKVAIWITEQTGRKAHPQLGWEYLRRLHFSKRVLRPRHVKADPQAQEAFKKN